MQRKLLRDLVATSWETERHKAAFLECKKALEDHVDAEERCFYKPPMDSDKKQVKARHNFAGHHELGGFIEDLETTEMNSSAWLKIAKDLKDRVEHYPEKEQEVFQLAGKVLSEKRKQSLAQAYSSPMDNEDQ